MKPNIILMGRHAPSQTPAGGLLQLLQESLQQGCPCAASAEWACEHDRPTPAKEVFSIHLMLSLCSDLQWSGQHLYRQTSQAALAGPHQVQSLNEQRPC